MTEISHDWSDPSGDHEEEPRAPGLQRTINTVVQLLEVVDPVHPAEASRGSGLIIDGTAYDLHTYYPADPDDPRAKGIQMAEIYAASDGSPRYIIDLDRDEGLDRHHPFLKSETFRLAFGEAGQVVDYTYVRNDIHVRGHLLGPEVEVTTVEDEDARLFAELSQELGPTPQESLADLTDTMDTIETLLWDAYETQH